MCWLSLNSIYYFVQHLLIVCVVQQNKFQVIIDVDRISNHFTQPIAMFILNLRCFLILFLCSTWEVIYQSKKNEEHKVSELYSP